MKGHAFVQERILGLWRVLAHQSIRHPWLALLTMALITGGVGAGAVRLKLRTDGHALVDSHSPEARFDKAIREKFDIQDKIVVLIRSDDPDGIFNPGTMRLVRDLTASLAAIPGISSSNIWSLATEPSFRLRPRTLIQQRLLEPPLKTKAELEQLREDIRRIKLYTGTLVGLDERSTAILIGTPAGMDRTQLYETIQNRVEHLGETSERIEVTGAPVAEALLGLHILEDLGLPRSLLGTTTRSRESVEGWRVPSSFHELRDFLSRRVGLLPLAVLVMIVVFWAAFRNVPAIFLPLPVVGAALVFVFGLMGWLGVPIYLTTAVMPVLLTAMCVTDEIHLFSRYFALLRERSGTSHVELIEQTLGELLRPVVSTTLTTAVGFLSFALSPLAPVKTFGVFTAVGMLFSLICTLTVVPALLTLIPPRFLLPRRLQNARSGTRLEMWFGALSAQVVRRRGWVMGFLLLVIALTPLGLRRLTVQDSWIDGFAPDSEFRHATDLVNEQYYGMHLLLVSFSLPETLHGELPASSVTSDGIIIPDGLVAHATLIAGSPITVYAVGDEAGSRRAVVHSRIETVYGFGNRVGARIPKRELPADYQQELASAKKIEFELVVHSHVRPEVIQQISDLASFIRKRSEDAVGGVLSPYDYLETTHFMSRPDAPNARELRAEPAEIKRMWDYYGLGLGLQRLRQIVDTNYWQSLTTVFLRDANFQDTARLMSDVRAYEREKLAPKGIKLGFAGDVAVSQSLIGSIVSTQLQSLIWSLLGIYAVTALLGRSWRWGLYAVIPSALAVLVNFAVMGWFGIPLGVATSMFAGMTLGLGVDFAIHMLEGYREARLAKGSASEALHRAMALTGPPVLINTLSISLGFGVLMLSQVPANARLGLLLVLALVNCLVASLLIVPVLLHWPPVRAQ